MRPGQLRTGNQGTRTTTQHTQPCADCPWARTALPGWLGELTVDEWLRCAHGETRVICHCHPNQQCAGVAIYRRNTAKMPHPPNLVLPRDTVTVFANRQEFTQHHERNTRDL